MTRTIPEKDWEYSGDMIQNSDSFALCPRNSCKRFGDTCENCLKLAGSSGYSPRMTAEGLPGVARFVTMLWLITM